MTIEHLPRYNISNRALDLTEHWQGLFGDDDLSSKGPSILCFLYLSKCSTQISHNCEGAVYDCVFERLIAFSPETPLENAFANVPITN